MFNALGLCLGFPEPVPKCHSGEVSNHMKKYFNKYLEEQAEGYTAALNVLIAVNEIVPILYAVIIKCERVQKVAAGLLVLVLVPFGTALGVLIHKHIVSDEVPPYMVSCEAEHFYLKHIHSTSRVIIPINFGLVFTTLLVVFNEIIPLFKCLFRIEEDAQVRPDEVEMADPYHQANVETARTEPDAVEVVPRSKSMPFDKANNLDDL